MRVKIIGCSVRDKGYDKEIGNTFKSIGEFKNLDGAELIKLEDLNGYIFCALKKDTVELKGHEGFIFLESIPVSPKFKQSFQDRFEQYIRKGFELKDIIWIGHQTDWVDGRERPTEDNTIKYILVLKNKDRIIKFEETTTLQNFYQVYGKVAF
jgi:hypothetical protein